MLNPVAVAAGGYFSLALLNNGTVVGWGDNSYGQTNIPVGLSNVTAIAAGKYHGVALLTNGSVTNWGSYSEPPNYYSVTNYSVCTAPPLSNVVAISAGIDRDLALLSNGTVVTWGYTNSTPNYVPIGLPPVQAIAAGWAYDVALLTNGTVVVWGDDLWGQTNVPAGLSNIVAIAAGAQHVLVLLSNGTVQAWGDGYSGDTNVPIGLSNVVSIAADGSQSLALQENGNVVVWGDASDLPAMIGAKTVSSGYTHNLAICSGQLSPAILEQPSGTYALSGDSFDFLVEAEGLGTLAYQWQFNGTNIPGATNTMLSITGAQATNEGDYDVVVSSIYGATTSSVVPFDLVLTPQITSTSPATPSTNWMNYGPTLSVGATAAGDSESYPLSFSWQLNGASLGDNSSTYAITNLTTASDGAYTVTITNAAGSTNVNWDLVAALPGMVESWGDNQYGECNRPAAVTNVSAIAAGEYQSVALGDDGTISQWGQYWTGSAFYSISNTSVATLAPLGSNLVAVSAGPDHVIGLTASGGVVTWGLTNSPDNYVPSNLPPVQAVGAGWAYNVALLTNGTVVAWGDNLFGQTNVPAALSNVTAIAAGAEHCLALSNGTVIAWGYNGSGQTSVPAGLTNVVAIAAGDEHSLALQANGTVVAWGNNMYQQTNVPPGLSNVMAIAAGGGHSVALQNNGVLVEWGKNSSGQATPPAELPTSVVTYVDRGTSPPSPVTNTYPPIVLKLIAAGGDHTLATIFSPTVQYPIIVSQDLLLIYNTNSADSSNVCAYYLRHRPMVSPANVLGIGCTTNEIIEPTDFTNTIVTPWQNWLLGNPTKRPQYIVLFNDIPSRVDLSGYGGSTPSAQWALNLYYAPIYQPFFSAINMNGSSGTNDCIAYINKLATFGSNYSPGQLIISASGGGYNPNPIWYFDKGTYSFYGEAAAYGVSNAFPTPTIIAPTGILSNNIGNYTSQGTNVIGYFTPGCDNWPESLWDSNMFVDGTIRFYGQSGWYIMTTIDSFNGMRQTGQASFLTWFVTNAFSGTNYSNTPVGAVSTVDEPGLSGKPSPYIYYYSWAAGKTFGIAAWWAQYVTFGSPGIRFQATGDPFVRK